MESSDKYIKTRVKLESFDVKLLTLASRNLMEGVLSIEGKAKGPIPLPTKRRVYCVLRSPHVDKKSREHFEIRTHRRILEIYTPKTVENLADSFLKIPIPPGVSIKLS
jgi:small subunit ribosomal protein S10